MRLSVKMMATAAFAALLMPAFLVRADEAAKPSAGAKDDKAADSSVAAVADTAAPLPPAPLPAASMAPASPYPRGLNNGTPRVEWFLGYSYLRAVPAPSDGNRLVWLNGGSTSFALNLNRYLGLVADAGGFADSEVLLQGATSSTTPKSSGAVFSYLFGPRLSFRKYDRVTPFAQVLFGGFHATNVTLLAPLGKQVLPVENTFAWTAGGGLDVRIHHHIALRIIQAEYAMTRFESFNTASTAAQNDIRISTGLVFRFGGNPPIPPLPPLSYSCSVNPSSAFPGDAIAVSGTALNLNPARTAVYTWSVTGGTVAGVSSSAKIDTTGLAPGSYTLKGHVSAGDKPDENADCTAAFTVRAYEPPTVSCVANPTYVVSGASSTITATGISPQNRPLTYSYTSTSGSVSGSGTTATLSTVGALTGTVGVTCTVVDDKGQTASGTTSVTVAAPVVAAKPTTSELCSVQFSRDSRRPARVDNEGKACLDGIALNLQQSSDAQLAIVGNAASGERGGKKLAGERAANTKDYLVKGKGIDAARIVVYTGSQDGKIVTTTLIPAGATFDSTGDTPVQ